jgi:hypothetical protein
VTLDEKPRQEHSSVLITKKELNLPLWQRIQELAHGDLQQKVEAATLIFDNYTTIPEEADNLLKEMVQPSSPIEVRLGIAEKLVSKPRIPWVLHVSLLEILIKDEDKGVVKLVEPMWEPYRALDESLRSYAVAQSKLLQSMIPTDFIKNIADIARINIPTDVIKDITKGISALSPNVMSLFQEQMKGMPFFKVPQAYFDTLSGLKRLGESSLRTMSSIAPTYYALEEQPAVTKAPENALIVRLKTIPPGKRHWREYQSVCRDILSFCFVPPLSAPLEESRTKGGHHRRDIIYNIPMGAEKFWGYVQSAFSAIAVIVDVKNYGKKLPPDEVVVVSKYLGSKKLGDFAIVPCRKGPSEATKEEQINIWRNDGKMIICTSDAELEQMVALKEAGDRPELVLDRLIREIRQSI